MLRLNYVSLLVGLLALITSEHAQAAPQPNLDIQNRPQCEPENSAHPGVTGFCAQAVECNAMKASNPSYEAGDDSICQAATEWLQSDSTTEVVCCYEQTMELRERFWGAALKGIAKVAQKEGPKAWKWITKGNKAKKKKPKGAHAKGKGKHRAHKDPFGNWKAKASSWPVDVKRILQKSLKDEAAAWKAVITKNRKDPAAMEKALRKASGPVKGTLNRMARTWGGRTGGGMTAMEVADAIVDVFKVIT